MTDVSKIQGPSGPPESSGKKDKASADADKFKQEMRKRVTEVREVDPDQQKKRKQRGEEDDDELPPPPTTTPIELVPHFSIEKEDKKASPFDIQKQGRGTSPIQLPQVPTPKALAGPNVFISLPPPSPETEEANVSPKQEASIETFPTSAEQAPPPPFTPQSPTTQTPPSLPPPEGGQAPQLPGQQIPEAEQRQVGEEGQAEQPQAASKSGTPQQTPSKAKEGTGKVPLPGVPIAAIEEGKEGPIVLPPPPPPLTGTTTPLHKNKGIAASQLEQVQPEKAEDTTAFFEQLSSSGQQGQQQQQKGKEKEEELEAVQEAQASPAPFPAASGKKEEKKDNEEIAENLAETLSISPEAQLAPPVEAPPPEGLTPYTRLSPDVMELFDRMVGVMTVMNTSGMSETVFTLNSPQFASSVFFGSQIIIQEFTTAPKEFNIQLKGSPQAVALFQGNTDGLMATFQKGNFGFRVNRLESAYLEEEPLFKRKGKLSGGDQDQTGADR